MSEVVMPQMGESIAEGTIVRWIKKVGDRVERDEPLFEISTDKVDAEIPAPVAGVLAEIRAKEGETVPVNSVVAVISSGRDEAAARAPGRDEAAAPPPPPAAQASSAKPVPATQAEEVPAVAPQAPESSAQRASGRAPAPAQASKPPAPPPPTPQARHQETQ